jgi:hypothetical protein
MNGHAEADNLDGQMDARLLNSYVPPSTVWPSVVQGIRKLLPQHPRTAARF